MIADVGAKLIGQFADCVASTLTAAPPEPIPAPAQAPAQAPAAQGAEPAAAAQSPPAALPPTATVPPTAEPAQTAEPAPAPTPASREAEPIDLLKLTGSTATARRLAWYALGTALLVALAWATVRWLRR
jgi:hypothetical protein